jgi:hypothetical protein
MIPGPCTDIAVRICRDVRRRAIPGPAEIRPSAMTSRQPALDRVSVQVAAGEAVAVHTE